MARAKKRFHDGLHQGLFCKLNIVLEMVLGVVRGAKAGEDFKLFLQASREVTSLISLMIKMDVQLEPEMIYCLMASPQWDLQDSLLPNSFQTLSQTRQTLKVNLFAPARNPNQTRFQLSPQLPKLKTRRRKILIKFFLSKLRTQNAATLPSLPGRTQEPAPKPEPENWQLATDTSPKNQRKMSVKNTTC